MNNSAAAQELYWPRLEGLHDRPLTEIPEEQRTFAIASVFPFTWDDLAPAQRESVIKQSDYPNDPATRNAFQAGFHGFDTLAKMRGITVSDAVEALLKGNSRLAFDYNADSLVKILSTNEELNAARDVFHPLAEWLRRARAAVIAYPSSLDWAVEQYPQRVVEASEKDKQPTFRPRIGWQIELFDSWLNICKTYARKPTPAEAIKWLKRNNKSGVILDEGAANELWWVPQRKAKATGNSPAQKGKMVTLHSVETVISSWSTKGRLPS